jgi:hypothetical protein
MCCVRSAICYNSDQPPDSNRVAVDTNDPSEPTPTGESPGDEGRGDRIPSGAKVPGFTNASSDDPNIADAEKARRKPFWLSGEFWFSNKMIAFYVVIGIAIVVAVGWFFLVRREVVRTRLQVKRAMLSDPELTRLEHGKTIPEFLIVFNWTQKVLYLPTIIVSLLAAVLIVILQSTLAVEFDSQVVEVIGGVWFAVFFLNFLVEEYNIRLMVIITSLVCVGFLLLWLFLFGWVHSFFHLFTFLNLFVSWRVYLIVGLLGLLTIAVSWVKGLFYYVVITPNYANVQEGLTESGTQIARRDFSTSVDTTDLLERLLGFGKIKISFKRSEREPMTLYVWRIGSKAKKLEEMGTKTIVT